MSRSEKQVSSETSKRTEITIIGRAIASYINLQCPVITLSDNNNKNLNLAGNRGHEI